MAHSGFKSIAARDCRVLDEAIPAVFQAQAPPNKTNERSVSNNTK